MLKTLLSAFLLVITAGAGIWFFSLKKYDYSLSFKTDEVPGEVYQKLLAYEYQKLNKTTGIKTIPFTKVVHVALLQEDTLQITWELSELSHTITKVEANVNHPGKPFWNRLKYLSETGGSKKELTAELTYLKRTLELDSVDYKVEIVGITNSPQTTCACIKLESDVTRKAELMIKTINYLSEFVLQNKIETTGRPRIVVKNWDLKTNYINYDFCFPIAEGSSYKPDPTIDIKKLPEKKSLKAIFNGNYRNSHFAWARLLYYAENNEIEVLNTPLEIFNDNPEMGGNSINWEAEIYMPLQ